MDWTRYCAACDDALAATPLTQAHALARNVIQAREAGRTV